MRLFAPIFNRARIKKSNNSGSGYGRPRRRFCTPDRALQMLLRKLAGGSGHVDMQLLSGVEGSVMSRYLHHAMHCLLVVLRNIPAGRMCMPNRHNAKLMAIKARMYMCRRNLHVTGDFIGAVDGKIVGRERPGNEAWQEANYNGKANAHAAKVLLIQLFDGTYGPSIFNFVGSAHDSRLSQW